MKDQGQSFPYTTSETSEAPSPRRRAPISIRRDVTPTPSFTHRDNCQIKEWSSQWDGVRGGMRSLPRSINTKVGDGWITASASAPSHLPSLSLPLHSHSRISQLDTCWERGLKFPVRKRWGWCVLFLFVFEREGCVAGIGVYFVVNIGSGWQCWFPESYLF